VEKKPRTTPQKTSYTGNGTGTDHGAQKPCMLDDDDDDDEDEEKVAKPSTEKIWEHQ
jgi:hypothetical protein